MASSPRRLGGLRANTAAAAAPNEGSRREVATAPGEVEAGNAAEAEAPLLPSGPSVQALGALGARLRAVPLWAAGALAAALAVGGAAACVAAAGQGGCAGQGCSPGRDLLMGLFPGGTTVTSTSTATTTTTSTMTTTVTSTRTTTTTVTLGADSLFCFALVMPAGDGRPAQWVMPSLSLKRDLLLPFLSRMGLIVSPTHLCWWQWHNAFPQKRFCIDRDGATTAIGWDKIARVTAAPGDDPAALHWGPSQLAKNDFTKVLRQRPALAVASPLSFLLSLWQLEILFRLNRWLLCLGGCFSFAFVLALHVRRFHGRATLRRHALLKMLEIEGSDAARFEAASERGDIFDGCPMQKSQTTLLSLMPSALAPPAPLSSAIFPRVSVAISSFVSVCAGRLNALIGNQRRLLFVMNAPKSWCGSRERRSEISCFVICRYIPAGGRCGRAAALLLTLVVAAEAADADHEAEYVYYDDMSDVDMKAFWLDGTLAPSSRADALPIRARPAGPTRTPPDPPDSDSSSWIRGWGLFGISWKDIGNRTLWIAEGMGGGTFRAVGSFRSAFSTREAGGWLSSDGGWALYMADQMGLYRVATLAHWVLKNMDPGLKTSLLLEDAVRHPMHVADVVKGPKIPSVYFLADVLRVQDHYLEGNLLRADRKIVQDLKLETKDAIAIYVAGLWKRCLQYTRQLLRGSKGCLAARSPEAQGLKSSMRCTYKPKKGSSTGSTAAPAEPDGPILNQQAEIEGVQEEGGQEGGDAAQAASGHTLEGETDAKQTDICADERAEKSGEDVKENNGMMIEMSQAAEAADEQAVDSHAVGGQWSDELQQEESQARDVQEIGNSDEDILSQQTLALAGALQDQEDGAEAARSAQDMERLAEAFDRESHGDPTALDTIRQRKCLRPQAEPAKPEVEQVKQEMAEAPPPAVSSVAQNLLQGGVADGGSGEVGQAKSGKKRESDSFGPDKDDMGMGAMVAQMMAKAMEDKDTGESDDLAEGSAKVDKGSAKVAKTRSSTFPGYTIPNDMPHRACPQSELPAGFGGSSYTLQQAKKGAQIKILLHRKAFWICKAANREPPKQRHVTWNKHGGIKQAWEKACHAAGHPQDPK
ncbi:unnamed protein product [Prorocentrum cordatum]|uniref:Uncharacterized protein n=1 Tax=Prorocentrum cordatum TaxID=2364126 RepID=A0ABN9XS92_9DINO|nr:unnamed protein product [Polarella glacialis]